MQKTEKVQLTSSVIIPTCNRLQDIVTCLKSLAHQTVHPHEIIIVDASDVSLVKEPLFCQYFTRHFFPATQLRYCYAEKPGLPFQRNQAMKIVSGDIVYFFDDDVILEPDYLKRMQTAFEEFPLYAGGMGEVTNISPCKKNIFWLVKKVFGLQRIYASGGFTWSGMPLHAYGTTRFKEVDVLGGCCMAYRSKCCKNMWFDEKLGRYAYMEDADFSWRISRKNALFFNPKARLQHIVSPQARDKLIATRALYIKNYSYLFFKNVYPVNRLKIIAYWWTILGLFTEAILLRSTSHIQGYWRGLFKRHG